MKCALPGCSKPGVAGDAFCSRAHATVYYTGQDAVNPAGSGTPRTNRPATGFGAAFTGPPTPVTRLQHEAALRDKQARERDAVAMELARGRLLPGARSKVAS